MSEDRVSLARVCGITKAPRLRPRASSIENAFLASQRGVNTIESMKVWNRCWVGWLTAQLSAGFAQSALAQGIRNVIPKDQPPITRTFPPSPVERTPSGTGKFVIFTREEVGGKGEWDFVAAAWECIPSKPELPITKRVEFCHSSWNASPLLDVLVRDDSRDRFPRFVRLQVNAGDRDQVVNLYDVNYHTWDLRCIWQGRRLSAFGAIQENVYCRDGESWFRLKSSSGAIEQGPLPFIPLNADVSHWVVRKPGDATGEWSYDCTKQQFVARFEPVAADGVSLLSSDGRNRAWILFARPAGWEGGTIHGTMILQRAGQGTDVRVPITMQARAGSARPVIPLGVNVSFTPQGFLEFTAANHASNTLEDVWAVDVATGRTTTGKRLHQVSAPSFEVFDGVPTPEYLRSYLPQFTHFGRSGLAPAFLMHLGMLKEAPEYPDCDAAVSPDGRHVFYRAKKGPLANVFIYGNLQSKKTVQWAAPAGIKVGDVAEFVWVETP